MRGVKFEDIANKCSFRTVSDLKCTHEKNPKRRLVGSCHPKFCPLSKEEVVGKKEDEHKSNE